MSGILLSAWLAHYTLPDCIYVHQIARSQHSTCKPIALHKPVTVAVNIPCESFGAAPAHCVTQAPAVCPPAVLQWPARLHAVP